EQAVLQLPISVDGGLFAPSLAQYIERAPELGILLHGADYLPLALAAALIGVGLELVQRQIPRLPPRKNSGVGNRTHVPMKRSHRRASQPRGFRRESILQSVKVALAGKILQRQNGACRIVTVRLGNQRPQGAEAGVHAGLPVEGRFLLER